MVAFDEMFQNMLWTTLASGEFGPDIEAMQRELSETEQNVQYELDREYMSWMHKLPLRFKSEKAESEYGTYLKSTFPLIITISNIGFVFILVLTTLINYFAINDESSDALRSIANLKLYLLFIFLGAIIILQASVYIPVLKEYPEFCVYAFVIFVDIVLGTEYNLYYHRNLSHLSDQALNLIVAHARNLTVTMYSYHSYCVILLDTAIRTRTKYSWLPHLILLWPVVFQFFSNHQSDQNAAVLVHDIIFFTFTIIWGYTSRYMAERQDRSEFLRYSTSAKVITYLDKNLTDIKEKSQNTISNPFEEMTELLENAVHIFEETAIDGIKMRDVELLINTLSTILTLSKSSDVYTPRFKGTDDDAGSIKSLIDSVTQNVDTEIGRMDAKSHLKMSDLLSVVNDKEFQRKIFATLKSALERQPAQEMDMNIELKNYLGIDPGFSMIDFGSRENRPLTIIGQTLLTPYLEKLECEPSVLLQFLTDVENHYFKNIYHNKIHAACVTHATHFLGKSTGVFDSSILNDVDRASILIAAMGHDLCHPGRNNNFMTSCFDSLSIVYNDEHVLENYSASFLLQLLNIPGNEVFGSLSKVDFRKVRRNVIRLILATDMTDHFMLVAKHKSRESAEDFNAKANEEDLWLSLRIIVKMADIIHIASTWNDHMQWSFMVAEEFYQQGEEEKKLGLSVSPLCDRADHPNFANGQAAFFQYLAMPLLQEVMKLDKDLVLKEVYENADKNYEKWKSLKIEGQELEIPEHIRQQKTPTDDYYNGLRRYLSLLQVDVTLKHQATAKHD